MSDVPKKKYTVWLYWGSSQGWGPEECDSIEGCIKKALSMCVREYRITRDVEVEFVEKATLEEV